MFACLIQNVRLNSYIMPCGKSQNYWKR